MILLPSDMKHVDASAIESKWKMSLKYNIYVLRYHILATQHYIWRNLQKEARFTLSIRVYQSTKHHFYIWNHS